MRGDRALIHIVLLQFIFSAFHHSYGDEFLMLHVPVSEAPKWSLVALAPIISAFRISAFSDSCNEESHHLTLPTPGIQRSEMELDQWSTP
jgi:hypothetical protein